jgi:hypothetical protein
MPDPESLKLCRALFTAGVGREEAAAILEALGTPPTPSEVASHAEPLPDRWVRAHAWLVAMPDQVRAVWSEADAVITGKMGRASEDGRLIGDVTTFSGPNSPLSRTQLTDARPEEVAKRVAAWRPKDSDPWGVSARGLERLLGEVIKESASEWSRTPVEIVGNLQHPTYIASYLRALAERADEVSDNAPALVRAASVVASEPWPVDEIGHDNTFDFDPDWTGAGDAAVELIGKLWSSGADMGDEAEKAWHVVRRAATNWADDLIEEFDDSPLTAAINRPTTRALDAAFSYAGLFTKDDGVIPSEFLEVLDVALRQRGREGSRARAIIAPRLPFLRAWAPEWFSSHVSQLIGNQAPDDLGPKTFDLYLEWGRPNKQFLEDFPDRYREALTRVPAHALDHVLHGMLWSAEPWSDVDHLVALLGAEQTSAAGNSIGIGLRDSSDDSLVDRAVDFWQAALDAELPSKAYWGFGWMTDVKGLSQDRWLDLADRTAAQAKGKLDWAHHVAERAAETPKDPRAVRIIASLLTGEVELWHVEEIARLGLRVLRESRPLGNVEEQPDRRRLRETLLERGFYEAKELD